MPHAVAESTGEGLQGPLAELIDAKYALADPAGRITRWGAGATALFGVGSEQMVGRSLFEGVLSGDDGGWHAFAGGDGKGATLAVDIDIKRPDGQSVRCAVQLVPVNLADGLDVSFLAADLTGGREPAERRLDALRLRHERALGVLERTLADGPALEDGDRLAGLIAIFQGDVPAPGAGGEQAEEALARAARAERELEDLRAPLEQARAETRALADRLRQLEADLRGRIDDALAAAEEARTEGAQARAASEQAARGSAEQAREAEAEQAERAREAELRGPAERGSEQARRELRGAQALGAAASPAGFFTYDGQLGEPDRPPRAGFDDAAEPIAKVGLDGSFMELNARFRDLVGYTEEEFASARWPSSADRDRIGEQRALLHALAAGEAEHGPVDSTYMHREGLLMQLSGRIQLVRSESGAPDHLLLTLDGR